MNKLEAAFDFSKLQDLESISSGNDADFLKQLAVTFECFVSRVIADLRTGFSDRHTAIRLLASLHESAECLGAIAMSTAIANLSTRISLDLDTSSAINALEEEAVRTSAEFSRYIERSGPRPLA